MVLFCPGKRYPVSSAASLEGKHVGTMMAYHDHGYIDSFASGAITRVDLKDEQSLLKYLFGERVDQIFINKAVAQYWMLQNPTLTLR